MDRRQFLEVLIVIAACSEASRVRAETRKPDEYAADTQPFDYAWLRGHARGLAALPYAEGTTNLPPEIADLDYNQYQSIQFRPEHSLWHEDALGIELRFFHMGLFFKRPIQLFEVVAGKARHLDYDPGRFDFGKSGVNGKVLPKDLGYAGFRIVSHINPTIDLAAFLGASYFRAVGAGKQYGMSARGLAVDTGMPHPEEFPYFTHYWFERPVKNAGRLVVYALLNSPSVTGAYRFEVTPGNSLVMDVDAAIYPRTEIARLGIAPLTSMFQTAENDRRLANDTRPEIHDSDGLAMWSGAGEWIWRPLENPVGLRYNAYQDENPRGFGLLQRDRDFENYQDDAVFYERRPGVWVETRNAWGRGAVTLVEIPTLNETFDNIVAFWNPAQAPKPGDELIFAYRLHWGAEPPFKPKYATVHATRTGLGGVVGHKRRYFSWRFAVDFKGGMLPLLAADAKVDLNVETSRGKIEIPSARPLFSIEGYRAIFDLVPDESADPINLRMFLSIDGEPLTETWFYQYSPPPLAERKY